VQAEPTRHQHRILIAEMPVQYQVGHGEVRADTGQEALNHDTDTGMFRIQGGIGLGLGAATLWSPWFPFRRRQSQWRQPRRFTQHLLHLRGECLPFAATDQGEREERDPRYGFAKDTRKEAIHAIGLRACFGHHTFITDQQHIIARGEHLGAYEDPEDRRPGQGGMKETLDGAIAASGSRPARESQHGYAPRHGQHCQRNPAQLANRGHRHLAGQAVEQW
jgi:hypothetical protein